MVLITKNNKKQRINLPLKNIKGIILVNKKRKENKKMKKIERITIIVLDSVGAGELPDANLFDDCGSNTLGNMAKAYGGMSLPNMGKLGLGNITEIEGTPAVENAEGAYGRAIEVSHGKDSTTGHWEIAGVPLERPFPNYKNGFSDELLS